MHSPHSEKAVGRRVPGILVTRACQDGGTHSCKTGRPGGNPPSAVSNCGTSAQSLISSLASVCVCVCYSLSRAQLFVTPWTVAHQAPLSMGFPRQEHWRRVPFLQSLFAWVQIPLLLLPGRVKMSSKLFSLSEHLSPLC